MNNEIEQLNKDKQEIEKIISEKISELQKKYPMVDFRIYEKSITDAIWGKQVIYKISAELP